MHMNELQKHIRTLGTLPETDAPVISCYLNLEDGIDSRAEFLGQRELVLKKSFAGEERTAIAECFEKIRRSLATLPAMTKGSVALFARGGEAPFFLSLQFDVPRQNWLAAGPVPNIYHLVEMKDTYHRFVVLIATSKWARIIEVHLGSVTTEIWKDMPGLRDRVDRGWTKEHYQHHREQQTEEFIREKIRILDKLMAEEAHSHLILSGDARMLARFRESLPRHLASKVLQILKTDERVKVDAIVLETIRAFVEREEQESRASADLLVRVLNSDGPAVIGAEQCRKALEWGQADVLIMTSEFDRDVVTKGELVRLAELNGCHVEIVNNSETLSNLGGVGCLLRYRLPDQIRQYLKQPELA